jgi:hypothetical protein
MEKKSKVGDLAKLAGTAEVTVEEWLAVLARCFQLQDGLAVLELDRVLDSSPDDVDRHRAAVRAGRAKRRKLISQSTERLLSRMDSAARGANQQVLFHPLKSGTVVRSGNEVAADVTVFHERLGIDSSHEAIETKRWRAAVGEARDAAIQNGSKGVNALAQFGVRTFEGAKSGAEKLSEAVAERLPHRVEEESPPGPEEQSLPKH